MSDTYTTQWHSPQATGGEWQDIVTKGTAYDAEKAIKAEVTARHHCRMIVHRDGQEDYTVEEYGPFNGPVTKADR